MAGVVWWLINLEKKGVGGDSVPYIEFVNSLASSSNVLIVKTWKFESQFLLEFYFAFV